MSGKTWVSAFQYNDGKLYWKYSPRYDILEGSEAGSSHNCGYTEICLRGVRKLRHQVVYYLHTGQWVNLIDHVDQDRSNDKFENLRPASRSLNRFNSDTIIGQIPYRGVSKARGKFVTYIKVDGVRKYLGAFKSAEEASHVYEKARLEVVQSVG